MSNTIKYFGYHANQLHFKMRNPGKVKYVHQKDFGNFEIPKHRNTSNIAELHKNYLAKSDWEKYMNPFGIKQTITSRFKKPSQQQDFVNHEFMLMRSTKAYDRNEVCFRVSPFLSKPEIK